MIRTLYLENFRNYQRVEQPISKNMVVVCGRNGSGKTNLFEAMSLFQSLRGLRKAQLQDFIALERPHTAWQIALDLSDDSVIGTAIDANRKRFFKCDGDAIKMSDNIVQSKIRFLWMTPAQDSLFIGAPSDRRQFMDRLIAIYNPQHNVHLKKYEALLKERMQILKANNDEAWLELVEKNIVQYGLLIFLERALLMEHLSDQQLDGDQFPHFQSALNGSFENLVYKNHADIIHKTYADALKRGRQIDFLVGGTRLGPHRSDWSVTHTAKDKLASFCSTGEQKMLLLAILINFVRFFLSRQPQTLVLLLDDVIGHLDFDHRMLLFGELMGIQNSQESERLQIWITGTQRDDFYMLENYAQFLHIEEGRLINE